MFALMRRKGRPALRKVVAFGVTALEEVTVLGEDDPEDADADADVAGLLLLLLTDEETAWRLRKRETAAEAASATET